MKERRQIPLSIPVADPHVCSLHTRVSVLAQVPLFAGLSAAELALVNERFRAHDLQAGEAVYHEGLAADRLYVVATGAVKTTRLSADGRETLLDLLSPGDFLGALPALGHDEYTDSAWMLTPGCLLGLDASDFTAVMEQFPAVMMATLQGVSRRLTESQDAVHMLSGAPLEQRLAEALLWLTDKFGEPWEGAILLQVPLSREDIASMTGAATESVSRVLSRWNRDGVLDTGRRWIAVRDHAALTRLRDGLSSDM